MFSSSCFSVYVSVNSLTPSFLYSDLNINIVIIKHKVSAIHPAYKTPNIPLFSANANINEIASLINNEIKRRLTEKKIRYYRQLASSPTINDQVPR